MNQEVLYFFDRKPEALPLYEAFEEKVFSEVDGVKVKVQKTQISFSNRHNFAFVSLTRPTRSRTVGLLATPRQFQLTQFIAPDGAPPATPSVDQRPLGWLPPCLN